MERWLQDVGKPALQDALAQACDRLGHDLAASCRDDHAKLAQFDALQRKAARVDDMQNEIDNLKSRIRHLDQERKKQPKSETSNQQRPASDPIAPFSLSRAATRTPLAPRSANERAHVSPAITIPKPQEIPVHMLQAEQLRVEFKRLERDYLKLHGKYTETEAARTELRERLREKIKNVERWQKHSTDLQNQSAKRLHKIKRLETRLASLGHAAPRAASSFSSEASDPDDSTAAITGPHLAPMLPLAPLAEANCLKARQAPNTSAVTYLEAVDVPPGAAQTTTGEELSREADLESTEGPSTSDIDEAPQLPPLPLNQGLQMNDVAVKSEPSSDIPVFVSTRKVRKRRREDDDIADTGVQTPTAVRVKTEEDSSGPIISGQRRNLTTQESMDFDSDGPRVETPKKHRSEVVAAEADDSHTAPAGFPRSCTAEERDIPAPEDFNRHDKLVTASVLAPSRTSALVDLDSNIILNRQCITPKTAPRPHPAPDPDLEDRIVELAEDGERNRTSRPSTKRGGRNVQGSLLDGLLNTPSAGQDRAVRNTDTRTAKSAASTTKAFNFAVPDKRPLPFGSGKAALTPSRDSGGARRQTKGLSAQQLANPSPLARAANSKRLDTSTPASNTKVAGNHFPGVQAQPPPLRRRPVDTLLPEDFKVNPAANEGYDYAFADVVRNKTDRAALPARVLEEYRPLAISTRTQASPAAFTALLEQHLGDDAGRLGSMTRGEKEALWIEARMRELANSHGRDRQRFERGPSPPGYWRTEFPTSQEEEADRAEARRQQRDVVRRRYEEAMRPGGRWIFRDEH